MAGDTRLQMLEKIGSGRNPVEETEYRSLLGQQQQSNPVPQSTNYIDIARQMQQLQQEANAPAVSSLQASIPETQQRFATERTRLEGEREPLKQRYQSILNEITRREQVDVSGQQLVTSREFGRRGIPLSSGLFESTLQQQVSPIRQFYTGQATETGLEQETGLRGLTNLQAGITGQETEATRAIQNAIAQLQAGGGSQAIQNALQIFQLNQAEAARQQELAFQQQQAERAGTLAQAQFEFQKQQTQIPQSQFTTLGEGSTLFNLLTGQPIFTAPKTYKSGGGADSDPLGLGF